MPDPLSSEIFTVANLQGEMTDVLDVSRLREWVEKECQPVRMTFAPSYRQYLEVSSDVDPSHAMALPPEVMAVPPIIMAHKDGGQLKALPVDGSHRLWRALGERQDVLVYLLPSDFVKKHFQYVPLPTAAAVIWTPGGGPGYDHRAHMERVRRLWAEANRSTSA